MAGGPFTFLTGLGLLGASAVSKANEKEKWRQYNEEYASHNYYGDMTKQTNLEVDAKHHQFDTFGGINMWALREGIKEKTSGADYSEMACAAATAYIIKKCTGKEYDWSRGIFKSSKFDLSIIDVEDYIADNIEEVMNAKHEEKIRCTVENPKPKDIMPVVRHNEKVISRNQRIDNMKRDITAPYEYLGCKCPTEYLIKKSKEAKAKREKLNQK